MNKKIKTLEEIRQDVYEKDALNSDYYANSGNLVMDETAKLKGLSKNMKVIENGLDDWALSQLFQKNKMPAAYFKGLLQRGQIDMVREHLNYHMENRKDDYLIRMREDKSKNKKEIRAVLSDEYSAFDSSDLFQIVEEPLSRLDYRITNYRNEDGIFMTRLVLEDMSENIGEKEVDDVLKVGLLIMNSEIGRSGIRIFPLAYRVVCSNGLVMWENMGEKERFYKKHRWIDRKDIGRWAAAAINEAIEESSFAIKKMKESKKIDVKNPVEYIEKRLPRINASVKSKIIETYQSDWASTNYKNSMYAVINSMTSVAREFNPELRLEIEKEAGKLIAA